MLWLTVSGYELNCLNAPRMLVCLSLSVNRFTQQIFNEILWNCWTKFRDQSITF